MTQLDPSFTCAVCGDHYEDFSGGATDSDDCASCGYDNSMSVTNTE